MLLLTLHLSESHVFVLLESLGTGGGSGSQHWVRKLTASVASPFRSSNMELTLEKTTSTFDISIWLFTLLTSRAHLVVQSVVLTVENQERNLVFQSNTIFSKSSMASENIEETCIYMLEKWLLMAWHSWVQEICRLSISMVSARLQYLYCWYTRHTAVLHWALNP